MQKRINMSNNSGGTWMSLSDIMTGLMLVFLFISILYMRQAQVEKNKFEDIIEEYKKTKKLIYNDLDTTFKDDLDNWNAEIDSNLVIRFLNPEILFESGKSKLDPKFKRILDKFIPKYINIITRPKYKNRIAEVRIEGHTDSVGFRNKGSYIGNLELSQDRSESVIRYMRKHNSYKNLNNKTKKRLRFWLVATGYSFSKQLDKNEKLVFKTGNAPNLELSRRVEFKIIPNLDKMFKKLSKETSK